MKRRLVLAGALSVALMLAPGAASAQMLSTEEIAVNPAAPAPLGHSQRYVIPFYTSQTTTPPGMRSTTLINVFNANGRACSVSVQFQFATATTNTCVITQAIPAKESRLFCSRPVNDPLAPCAPLAGASCSPALTFNTGHAFVSSTNNAITPGCNLIAVDAQLVHTRDAADDLVESVSKLNVQRVVGTAGD